MSVISRFASIGPVAGSPNLGYLEVNVFVKMLKIFCNSERCINIDDQGAKIPNQCDRPPWD